MGCTNQVSIRYQILANRSGPLRSCPPGIFDTPGDGGEVKSRDGPQCACRERLIVQWRCPSPPLRASLVSKARMQILSFGPAMAENHWKVLLPPSSHLKGVTAASTRCTVVHDTRPVCACIQNTPIRSRKRLGLEPSHDFMLVKKCNVFDATLWPALDASALRCSARLNPATLQLEICTR